MLPGIPIEYYYPIFSFFMFSLAYLLIPREKFTNLFWFGLIWGFLFNIIFNLIFGSLFNLFRYQHTEAFSFLGSPLWINFAWIFAVMLYLYYLPQETKWYLFPLYIFTFSVASAALDLVFNQTGMLTYANWNPFYRFIFALIWFYGLTLHSKALAPPKTQDTN